jgi:PAS domain S-box-containing protein
MNDLVLFSLILLIFLRLIGIFISIDFHLRLKKERFRLFTFGWLTWIIGGVLPILSIFSENELVSQSLKISNAVLVSLGALFIIMGVILYFKQISLYTQLLFIALIPIVYTLLSFIIGFSPAGRIILGVFVLISVVLFSVGIINRKILREYIGGSMFWFYTTFLFYAMLLVILIFNIVGGYTYGLYDSDDIPVIVLNYFFGIGFTLLLLVLFIHSEHSLSSKELKESQKMLDESEERYKSLITNIPAVTWISNKKGETTFISPNVERIYGYTPEEIYAGGSELWFGRVHPDDIESVKRSYQALFEENQSFDIEYRIQRKDGQWIWVHDKAIVFYEKDEDYYSYGVFTDVTERKRIERKLTESEERYRTLFESTPMAVLITDLEGKIITFNKQLTEQTGYTNEELHSANALSFYAIPEDRKLLLEQLRKDGQVRDYELRVQRKDGSIRFSLLNIDLIGIKEENLVLTTILDITERKEAEILKEELEKRRDDFISMTSHELLTPLQVFRGYIDFLSKHEKKVDSERKLQIFEVLSKNIDRLERLSSDVQSISLIESGTFEIVRAELRFCEFLNQFFTPYIDLLGESFEFHLCNEEDLTIYGDKDRIQQALDNIMINAINQTLKDTRKIIAEVKILPTVVEIIISDNGVGIKPVNLEKIFEKFVSIQTDVSVTGTGIGLFLTRQIMHAHNGSVHAESKGKGHGAKFIIRLPKQ